MSIYDHPQRRFDPETDTRFGRPTFNPDKLVKYSPKWEYARLMHFPFRGSGWRPRMASLVLSVDGGSSINDSSNPDSRAAYGVYFGPGCRWNRCGTLDYYEPQTSSRAELKAVYQALRAIETRQSYGELDQCRDLVIKTDSTYVANSLTDWIWRWAADDFYRADGNAVKNRDLMMDIHKLICDLEESMSVRFWRVGREWNQEPDALVKRALSGSSDSGYDD